MNTHFFVYFVYFVVYTMQQFRLTTHYYSGVTP
jgi:hypothetical protein